MIKLVCVGKCKEKSLISLIEEYLKRIKAYSKIEIIEVNEVSAPQSNSSAQNEAVMIKEGQNVLNRIADDEYVILLDLHGKQISSEVFAEKINEIQTYSSSKITFVIGGSLGVSDKLVNRANFRWKLSECTFPHQLVRLLVVEQIYRSYKILNKEPYHK